MAVDNHAHNLSKVKAFSESHNQQQALLGQKLPFRSKSIRLTSMQLSANQTCAVSHAWPVHIVLQPAATSCIWS
jgi:hypothetical protein